MVRSFACCWIGDSPSQVLSPHYPSPATAASRAFDFVDTLSVSVVGPTVMAESIFESMPDALIAVLTAVYVLA